MIISENQITQLMTIAHAYVASMLRVGEHWHAEIAQELLTKINDQQSEELKEIK